MSGAMHLPPSSDASAGRPDEVSFARLLFTTPLSQLLRGRVTGSKARLARTHAAIVLAALPPTLQAVVREVADRTRLWSSEKREITRELAAHFADGLDSGRSADELIGDFGDPPQAAKLLRRAAKRNRPWPWRAVRFALRATALTIGIVLLLYGGLTARYYFSSAGPIVDLRPKLNAVALNTPDEDKAWPLYRESLLAMPEMREWPDNVTNDLDLQRTPLPGEYGWDRIEASLSDHAKALTLMRQAAAKPHLGLIVGYDFAPEDAKALRMDGTTAFGDITSPDHGGIVGVLLPHLVFLRRMANTLGLDAHRAAAAGDARMACADITSMLAMSRHVRESPILIGDLVGLAIMARTCDTINRLLATSPELFSEADLTALAHSLAAFGDDSFNIRFNGERLFFEDMLQRVYSDNGAGDGHLTPSGQRWLSMIGSIQTDNSDLSPTDLVLRNGPALSAVMLGRRDMRHEFQRVMDMIESEADVSLWERDEPPAERIIEEWMASPIERLRRLPLVLLMPALSKATITAQFTLMRRDATLTAIALEIYRRRHGAWPNSLAELSPELLPALPIDRFDGQPLRYTVRDGNPLLYSVGSDREDDGGILPPLENTSLSSRQWHAQQWLPRAEAERRRSETTVLSDGRTFNEWDGDWILWPPLPEPPLRVNDPATGP